MKLVRRAARALWGLLGGWDFFRVWDTPVIWGGRVIEGKEGKK